MIQWLVDLVAKINAVVLCDTSPAPDREVAEGEEVIGPMSEALRRLYVVFAESSEAITAQCGKAHDAIDKITDKAKDDITLEEWKFIEGHFLAHEDHQTVEDIFWRAVHREFPKTTVDRRGVGVRKDWLLVYLVPEERQMPDLVIIHAGVRLNAV